MASTDYIPNADGDFNAWFVQFESILAPIGATYGFTPAELTDLSTMLSDWQSDYSAHIAAQNSARAARVQKDGRRADAEQMIRQYVRRLQSHPAMTDSTRAQLGISIPSGTRTRPQVPAEAPRIEADWSQRGQVTLTVGGGSTSQSNTFVEFAKSVQIQYRSPGGEWQLAGVTTKRTFVHVLNNTEPVTVAYRACYLNSQSEAGPWSETDFAFVSPIEVLLSVEEAA